MSLHVMLQGTDLHFRCLSDYHTSWASRWKDFRFQICPPAGYLAVVG